MKKSLILFALGLVTIMPAHAQWTHYDTQTAISGVFGAINHSIESAERKKQMEIFAQEKAQYEQSFKDAMESAKDYEGGEYWEDALAKYEEAAKLNCNYGYTDQQQISRKISELYVKAGRTEEGPSILNNAKVTLADYSKYRYVRENPIYINKKETGTKIVRVACSDTETRLELEYESAIMNGWACVGGSLYQGQQRRQEGIGECGEYLDVSYKDLCTLARPETAFRPDFRSPARGCQGVRLHPALHQLAVQGH